ncbi:RsmB/NOP family class I SAM-dependent RNA methyltransferase [Marivivens donghaensis]|uniref:RsmB/NOP family class I SAM-dependent RNA methyltransferase n=1 Tax=Marivivens donghaensis TaxID=1699413 RepID=A0ABX0VYK9_9RHOB|nr:RsmB/NOP family class I SAM-dependent RNA methyltransferase [Marivivens donghaensis]NIY72870.1 RsmB/NOP family class I SAM-dependent RNA methyltransferase [Marivivens donghaensis]
MTPAARYAAAITILDEILGGDAAEPALLRWSRNSRFAGSKDRAAVRDIVFDGLRRKMSAAAVGGSLSGRGIVLGLLRQDGLDPSEVFTGIGHAPVPLAESEQAAGTPEGPDAVDWPAWLWPMLEVDWGEKATEVAGAQRDRAPVFIRTNTDMVTAQALRNILANQGIGAELHSSVSTALEVTDNARKLTNSEAFADGLFEPQDAASQAAVLRLPINEGDTVLDYCAGGGGKSLALAARGAKVTAHDIDERRMKDIPVRAERAGVKIDVAPKLGNQNFDLVFCDAPCSGSGTWRRTPDAKWRLTDERLADLMRIQASVLRNAAPFVKAGGTLAYATCSVLTCENRDVVNAFCEAEVWEVTDEMSLIPSADWDGFYLSVLRKLP